MADPFEGLYSAPKGPTRTGLGSAASDMARMDMALAEEQRKKGQPVIRSGLGSVASDPFGGMYRDDPRADAGIEADVGPTGVPIGLGSAAASVDMGRLDQAIAEDRAASQAPAVSLGAAAPPSALQSAMAEREGEIGALLDALGQPVTYGRKANPMRPIVERDAQNFYGGGSLQLEPFIPPPPEAGEDEWSYMERVQQLQAEDQQRQITEAQTLGDVRDIGRDGHLGMGEAQLQAAENVSAAELQQAERVAEVQRKTAEASRAATAEVRAADAERRDFARQKRDALDQVLAVQADARERLQSLPELDPNRSFKSMEGGAKFWAILGSLAGGAIGSNEVPSRLMEIASRDLDAQKANAAQVFDAAAAADAGVAQQTALYRDLLAAAGDEAAADAMFLQLQLEDAARELEAQLAETTVPKLQAELQQSLVGVRQQIDAQQRAVDVQLASTPKSFLVQTGGLGPRSRKLAEKRVARLEEERFKLQMAGIEGEGKAAEKAYDRETKLLEKGAERETKLAEKEAEAQKGIKEKTMAWGQVETMLDDMLAARPGEMYTVGIPGMGEKGQRIEEEQFWLLMPQILTTAVTGANSSPEQAEAFNELVTGDWADWTDEDRRARLRALKGMAGAQRRYLQKELGSSRREVFDAKREVGSFRSE